MKSVMGYCRSQWIMGKQLLGDAAVVTRGLCSLTSGFKCRVMFYVVVQHLVDYFSLVLQMCSCVDQLKGVYPVGDLTSTLK